MRNISFNFTTQIVSRLEIRGLKGGLLTDLCVPFAHCKYWACRKYLRDSPWLWFQEDTPGGPLLAECPSRERFYRHTALFSSKRAMSLTKTQKTCQTKDYCPHFTDKENEAQRG